MSTSTFGPHPNYLDKLFVKIYSRYLYPGQACHLLGEVYVGILHRFPNAKECWKISDYVYLKSNSTMKYLGLATDLGGVTDAHPNDSLFESVNPILKEDALIPKHIAPGDIILITPTDRQYVAALPLTPSSPDNTIVTNT
jgi:hypothetical protein